MKIKKLFYDVETVGLDYRKHSIVQLSGFIEIDGKIVEHFDFKIRPHPKSHIDEEALKVNRKTIEEIQKYEVHEKQFKKFNRLLDSYCDKYNKEDKIYLIGYNNTKFDDFFLRKYFELNGNQFFNSYFYSNSLDVMVLASEYLLDRRSMMPSFKLFRVAKELGIYLVESNFHDSKYDVKITKMIYDIVTKKVVDPSKGFFYYKNGSTFWKTFEEDLDSSDYRVSFKVFRSSLHRNRQYDGDHLIRDDLFY